MKTRHKVNSSGLLEHFRHWLSTHGDYGGDEESGIMDSEFTSTFNITFSVLISKDAGTVRYALTHDLALLCLILTEELVSKDHQWEKCTQSMRLQQDIHLPLSQWLHLTGCHWNTEVNSRFFSGQHIIHKIHNSWTFNSASHTGLWGLQGLLSVSQSHSALEQQIYKLLTSDWSAMWKEEA